MPPAGDDWKLLARLLLAACSTIAAWFGLASRESWLSARQAAHAWQLLAGSALHAGAVALEGNACFTGTAKVVTILGALRRAGGIELPVKLCLIKRAQQ